MSMSENEALNLEKGLDALREAAAHGADLILIPTANTEGEPMEMFDWEVKVQAFQNSVAIAMCNRTGVEGTTVFFRPVAGNRRQRRNHCAGRQR